MAMASANKFLFQAKKISAVVTPYKSLDFYLFFHFFPATFISNLGSFSSSSAQS